MYDIKYNNFGKIQIYLEYVLYVEICKIWQRVYMIFVKKNRLNIWYDGLFINQKWLFLPFY